MGSSSATLQGFRLRDFAQAPWFAWLIAIYPVLFIASANPGQAPWTSVLIASAFMLAGATVLFLLARPALGSSERAALLVALAVVIFFAYGPLHGRVEEEMIERIERGLRVQPVDLHWEFSLRAVVLLLVGALLFRLLPQRLVAGAARILNVFAVVLVTIVALKIGWVTAGSAFVNTIENGAPGSVARASAAAPDIYYIILDGYARADILREQYDFDNSPFVEALRQRGFAVNDSSAANYGWTFLSLSTSLNYQYLDVLLGKMPEKDTTDRSATYGLIQDNAAARFLRERGYSVYHMQSAWGATRNNPFADVQLRCHGGIATDEFLRALIDATWLKILYPRLTMDLARCHNRNFEALGASVQAPGPKFVFAHFLLPHHPYLFDADGNVLRNADLSSQFDLQARLWERKDLYLGQLTYVNRRILAAIDALLKGSRREAVIVLQSDHGPLLLEGLAPREQVRVRLANFAAYRLPGAPAGLMPRDGSPVNQFRRIFNHYFDARLPLLPERHFVSPFRRPFNLTEVSELPLGLRESPQGAGSAP